jgi:hypothetical protein
MFMAQPDPSDIGAPNNFLALSIRQHLLIAEVAHSLLELERSIEYAEAIDEKEKLPVKKRSISSVFKPLLEPR